ncbi:SDR family NAD(P)-dependent oxidoreductase [Nitrospinota bacterium]
MNNREMFDLTDKVAVVTGGAGAIGSVVAKGLAEFGAHIVIADINLEGGEEVAQQVESLGRKALALNTDVSRQDEVQEMVRSVKNSFGTIDILFNNAGIIGRYPAEELPLAEWARIIEVNLTGAFLVAQAVAVTAMIPQKAGKIINTSSFAAFRGRKRGAAYASSKSGLIALTRVLANDWGKYNINVNSLAPSNLDTPMTAPALSDPERRQRAISSTPLGRLGKPEDLFGTVLFLASRASDFVTGQIVSVEGGRYSE